MTIISGLKEFGREYRFEIVLGAIFFLIATLSFGLGYVTHMQMTRTPIILQIQPAEMD